MQKTKKSPVSMDSAHRVKKEKIIIAENVSDSAAPISDAQKRAFLKALGIAGAGALVYSMFPKKASAMIFGSSPGGSGTTDPTIATTLARIEDEILLGPDTSDLATEATVQEIKTAIETSGYGGGIYVSPDGTYPEAEMKTYAEWLVDRTGFWQVIFLPAAAASVSVSAISVSSSFVLLDPVIQASGDSAVSVTVVSFISSMVDPVINTIANADVAATVVNGTISIIDPSVTAVAAGDVTISVATISATTLVITPVISTQQSSSVAVTVLTAAAAIIDPVITTSSAVDVTVSASVLASTMAIVPPVISAIGNASFAATAIASTSAVVSPVVTVPAGDSTAPAITSFTGTASGMIFTITALTATDAVGLTGYKVTETNSAPTASEGASSGRTAWVSSPPATVTVTGTGITNMYAWAKDAAGNVSASATVGSLVFEAEVMAALIPTNPGAETDTTITLGTGFVDSAWKYDKFTDGDNPNGSASVLNSTISPIIGLRSYDMLATGGWFGEEEGYGASSILALKYCALKSTGAMELVGNNKAVLNFTVKQMSASLPQGAFSFYFNAYNGATLIYNGGDASFYTPPGQNLTQNCTIDMNALKVLQSGTHTWADVDKVEMTFSLVSPDDSAPYALKIDNFRETL